MSIDYSPRQRYQLGVDFNFLADQFITYDARRSVLSKEEQDRLTKVFAHMELLANEMSALGWNKRVLQYNEAVVSEAREKQMQAQKAAVMKIQSMRTHFGNVEQASRKASEPMLSEALFERAKSYIDRPESLERIPRACSGKTPVYLLREWPIVLKRSGSPANQKRFDQMTQARDICERNGYEHLVVPKARVYRDFIIENRLPITMGTIKEQIGLYVENREQFAEAVKEFTGLMCQSSLSDITGAKGSPYQKLSKTPVGRYDNVALYLEEGQGKIGLIDLERFRPECIKKDVDWCFNKCRTLIYLFPYHFDEIMSVAQQFDPQIRWYHKPLKAARDDTLQLFKLAYEDHLDLIRNQGIGLENPTLFKKLGRDRIEELKEVIEKELRSLHKGPMFKGCLGEIPEQTLISFNEEVVSQFLEATYKLLNNIMESNRAGVDISNNLELVLCRTLIFDNDDDSYQEFIESNSKLLLKMLIIENHKSNNLAHRLLHIILSELEKGKEIAYYEPLWEGAPRLCVFC